MRYNDYKKGHKEDDMRGKYYMADAERGGFSYNRKVRRYGYEDKKTPTRRWARRIDDG